MCHYLDEFDDGHQKLTQSRKYLEGADEFLAELRLFRCRAEVVGALSLGCHQPTWRRLSAANSELADCCGQQAARGDCQADL